MPKSERICENCKTGANSYKLDPTTQVCPYMEYHYNNKCRFYEPIEIEQEGVLKKINKFIKFIVE